MRVSFELIFQSSWKYEAKYIFLVVGLVDVRRVNLDPNRPNSQCRWDGRSFPVAAELRDTGCTALAHNIGKGTVVVELTARPRRLKRGELYVLIFNAGLEVVLPVNLCEVIRDLESLADFVRGQEVVASQCSQSPKTEGRQTTVLGYLRNTLNSVFVRNPHLRPDRSETSSVQVVETAADLVDGAWIEHVRPSRNGLIGFGSLDALLEAAAVGDASEGTRNVLRVIGVTEAEEYLFFLGGVEIEPGVEGVFVFVQLWARCKIVIRTRVGRARIEVEESDRRGIHAERRVDCSNRRRRR